MVSVFVALDRSGSMSGEKWTSAIDSINDYITNLQKEEVEGDVTVIAFDSNMQGNVRLEPILENKSIAYFKRISPEVLTPSGMTPLYDAAAHVMDLALKSKAERAVVVIMTDGAENSSREYTQISVKQKVDTVTKKGYEVIFLGANFDVSQYTAQAGLNQTKMRSFDLLNMNARMAMSSDLASSTVAYAATGKGIEL